MIGLLSRLRERKTEQEKRIRQGTIKRALLSETEFFVLETMVDLWNANLTDYTQHEIIEKLCGNSNYPLENLSKDIAHLRSRGFVYHQKEYLFPTFQGALLYRKAHPQQLIRAACDLPDSNL